MTTDANYTALPGQNKPGENSSPLTEPTPAVMPDAAGIIPIANVPVDLIKHAVQQWELCGKYAAKTGVGNSTNGFIKCISVWLILKNETSSGSLKEYRKQLPCLAAKCKLSIRTLEARLAWLKNEQLVSVQGKHLVVHQYAVLKKYGINPKKREQTILYDTSGKTTLAEMLIAVGLQYMQKRRMRYYWKKLTGNPDVYKRVYDFLVYVGADATKLQDPETFRQYHQEALIQSYQEEKPGQPAYHLLHTLTEANPDLNCTTGTYGQHMGYTVQETFNKVKRKTEVSSKGFGHLKRRLAARGLITVEKDHIESNCRSRKDEKVFHHRWLAEKGQTIWFRCDQLTIQTGLIFGLETAA